MNLGFGVPSSGLSLVIINSVSKILGSVLSEVGGFGDFIVGSIDLSSVFSNALVALFKGGLANLHEAVVSSNLVFLVLMGIGKSLMALVQDVIEHTENTLDGALVGEVLSKSEHDLDHLSPLGSVHEMLLQLLDVVLGSLDLYE